MTRVAFCGLGIMGEGMARRLVGAGFEVSVFNRTTARAQELEHAGARVAATPAEAAQKADFIIAMVADDDASREVWAEANGALKTARRSAVLIDSSTITPQWVRELATIAKAHGCPLLDAPVTGSKPQAASGELLFLVGGDAAVLEKAKPVLKPMSRGIVHLGANGAGATMKLINNFLCGVQTVSLAEALAWMEKTGLETSAAVSILTAGAPGSPLVKGLAERMNNPGCEVNFRLDLMTKDLRYAASEAQQRGIGLLTGIAALGRFEEAVARGLSDHDLSAVIEAVRE